MNREKHVKEDEIANVKSESNVDKVTVNPLDLNAKQTTCIDSDTMAKIDFNIEKLSDRFACKTCSVCNKSFRSSNSLRNHDYRAHRRNW